MTEIIITKPVLENELTAIVGRQYVLPGAEAGFAVDGLCPKVVVFPADSVEVAALVNFAASTGLAIIPAGAGSGLSVGNVPTRFDVLLSTTRMNRVIDYEPADLTARVESGCTLWELNRILNAERQWLPLDPPGADKATLGGVAATDAFGPLRHAYGRARDYVIGIEVVLASGKQVKSGGRVVKNVTGYDLNKLFVGSFGTLGVIVQLNVKLRPVPECDRTVVLSGSVENLFRFSQSLLRTELLPAALLLVKSRSVSQIFTHAGKEALLLVRLLETESAVRYQFERLEELAAGSGLDLFEAAGQKSGGLWAELANGPKAEKASLTLRLSSPPTLLPRLYSECENRLGGHGADIEYFVQTGPGIVTLRGEIRESADAAALVENLKELRLASQELGGSLTIEQAPLEIKRQIDVWGEAESAARLMKDLKRRLDPPGIFSPGRFVAGI
jgi:glycolate oxidase FAD binding subunit